MTNFLIRHFVKNTDLQDPLVRDRYGYLGATVGVLVNLLLFVLKLTVGLLINSISVTADVFNNLSDMASSVVTMLGFKLASLPADEDHPYGHGRLEYFSGLIVSVLVMYVGIQFFATSIKRIINPSPLEFQWVPIILLMISILAKVWISIFNQKIGDKINSSALKASALDARGDVLISSTVIVGLLFSHFTAIEIDGYVGLFVAIMIIKTAFDLIKETIHPLLGAPVSEELIIQMDDILLSHPEVFGIHDTVTHNYGPNTTFASTHVEVRDDISLIEIHDIIDELEIRVKEELGIELVIHMDPVHMSDEKMVVMVQHLREELLKVDGVHSLHDLRLRDDSTRFIADLVASSDANEERVIADAERIIRQHKLIPQLNFEFSNIMRHEKVKVRNENNETNL